MVKLTKEEKAREKMIKDLSHKEQVIYGYWECIKDINLGLERTK